MSVYVFLKVLGSLALLMYGMKTMSEGLQKLAGPQLRLVLGKMTSNRFTGLLTGAFVTTAVQSSTATTVMTVSFVNAGLLTLAQAISVVMGANIGTTMTAWIMSAGFNFNMGDVVFPFFIIAIILIYCRSNTKKNGGELIFGICFLFLGLATLRQNAADMDLGHNQEVLDFFARTGGWGFGSTLLFLFLGGIMTMCVQSSAAVMAITMILCSSGALPIYQGIALVMGENIGTTVTSNVAAVTGNSKARCAALAHLVFNLFGVIWVLCCFTPFVNMVCYLVGYDPTSPTASPAMLSVVLAAFHTSFNVCNVLVLIWFVKPIERLVSSIIPQKKNDDDDFRLRFISGGMLSTPELSVLEAKKEIIHFAERTMRMFGLVRKLLDTHNDKEFTKLYSRIEKYEGISDNMELEIAHFLNKVSEGRLSSETKWTIRTMLREVTEIESIGDSCYNLARTIDHKRRDKDDFTAQQYNHIYQMFGLTKHSLEQMMKVLGTGSRNDALASVNIENEINNYRKDLKRLNVDDLSENKYSYQLGVYYLDIINECEKLGDYVINVVEARTDMKDKNGV